MTFWCDFRIVGAFSLPVSKTDACAFSLHSCHQEVLQLSIVAVATLRSVSSVVPESEGCGIWLHSPSDGGIFLCRESCRLWSLDSGVTSHLWFCHSLLYSHSSFILLDFCCPYCSLLMAYFLISFLLLSVTLHLLSFLLLFSILLCFTFLLYLSLGAYWCALQECYISKLILFPFSFFSPSSFLIHNRNLYQAFG